MLLALYLQTQCQQPQLHQFSPGSGAANSRYVWSPSTTGRGGFGGIVGGGGNCYENGSGNGNGSDSMASSPDREEEDSGTGSTDSHVIRHIDRTILSCQICQHRYRDPKVLPCLHTFCLGCLANYLPPESLAITCPLCGQQSIIPQKGLKALQANYFLTHLIEVLQEDSLRRFGGGEDTSTVCGDNSLTLSSYDDISDDYYEQQQQQQQQLLYSSHSVIDVEGVEYYVTSSAAAPPSAVASSGFGDSASLSSSSAAPFDQGLYRTLLCANHSGQSLRFYCQDCDTGICSSCTDIAHREHLTLRMSEAVEKEKEELRGLVEKAQSQVPTLKQAIENVNALSSLLQGKQLALAQEINKVFDQLIKIVEARRMKILEQLLCKENAKQKTLGKQRDDLEGNLADIYTSCEFVEKALAHGSETEILLVKKQVGDRLAEFSQMKVATEPAETSYLVFHPGSPEDMEGLFDTWCQVGTSSALPSRTDARGGALKQCFVGRPSLVTLATKDWQGQPVGGPEVEHFFCEIVPLALARPNSGPIELTTELTDMEDGSYELHYTVPVEGSFELAVKMFDEHICGSPFKITAKPAPDENCSSEKCLLRKQNSAFSWQSTTSSAHNQQQQQQQHRRVRSKSHLLATTAAAARPPPSRSVNDSQCSRNNPIEDDLVLKIGARGRGKAEFTNPQGVAVAPNGRVMVTDSNNQCLQVFGAQGELRSRFGVRGRCPGQMQRPTGVCVLPSGNVAVADYDNRWVSVFDPTGKFVNKIGTGKLLGPKGVAVDQAGHLVVVDNKASSILIFQLNGKLLHKFGSRGGEDENLAGPHYVAINSLGHIIVSDFHNHSIKVFDSAGEFQFCFGSNGEGNGQFNAPTGVAVDRQDNILVADWGNSRIQIFDSQGSFLAFVNTLACPLYGPQGMALTPDGHIVVADSGNHCFKLYRYLQ